MNKYTWVCVFVFRVFTAYFPLSHCVLSMHICTQKRSSRTLKRSKMIIDNMKILSTKLHSHTNSHKLDTFAFLPWVCEQRLAQNVCINLSKMSDDDDDGDDALIYCRCDLLLIIYFCFVSFRFCRSLFVYSNILICISCTHFNGLAPIKCTDDTLIVLQQQQQLRRRRSQRQQWVTKWYENQANHPQRVHAFMNWWNSKSQRDRESEEEKWTMTKKAPTRIFVFGTKSRKECVNFLLARAQHEQVRYARERKGGEEIWAQKTHTDISLQDISHALSW